MSLKVLCIDDDIVIGDIFSKIAAKSGDEICFVPCGKEGLEIFGQQTFDLVITDLNLPDTSGQDIVKKIKEKSPETEIIVITGHRDIQIAINIMKLGAYDFWLKPIHPATIMQGLENIKRKILLEKENLQLKKDFQELSLQLNSKYYQIIGQSKEIKKIFALIESIKDLDSTVVITGETGTGKELIARAIHKNSKRKNGPFVAVDCGALPENLLDSELFGHEKGAFTGALQKKLGRFERASQGTIFLDEINNTPPLLQQKLLRVIQERVITRIGGEKEISVDVRIIAASNRSLLESLKEGLFREDLYYRLQVIPIFVPPLRERKEDILPLTKHFFKIFSEEMSRGPFTIAPALLNKMLQYPWPGNVRELRNLLERSVALSTKNLITDIAIPSQSQESIIRNISSKKFHDLRQEAIWQAEKQYLMEKLEFYKGRVTKVAQDCQIARKTLYRKMKQYDLSKEMFKK